ncbi:MAG: hypothetical protein CVU59_08035 [Deltaproteobacteria bacterium HGW-Deltaproteobacteria-17]|nr:MAG: hypothetical protein CVU59_08035 [Deltaproteobacteria bacterium HGW-Deltaproteobacteria-17]
MLRKYLTILILSSLFIPAFNSCTSKDSNKKPPVFVSVPGTEASEGVAFAYPVDCTDPDGNVTTVTVLSSEGKPDSSENAQRILKLLADDLK